MEHALQITFRGLAPDDKVRKDIEERAGKLQRYFDKIESCRVVVASPHKHRLKGRVFEVRLRIRVPGREIIVSADGGESTPKELSQTVHDAFKEARRMLEDHVQRRRRLVKHHESPTPESPGKPEPPGEEEDDQTEPAALE